MLAKKLFLKVISKGTFVVTGSNIIKAGQPYKAAVFGYGFKKDEQITIELKSSDGQKEVIKVCLHENEHQIVNFNVSTIIN